MAVRVQVSSNPRVLHPTGAGSDAFLHSWPEPTHAELGLGAGFIFHPWVHPKLEKTRNPKETHKKPETRKPPEKTQNPKKLIYKTRRAPKLNPKSDGFGFGCQISPADSGVKFNLTTIFRGSSFWSTRPKHDTLPSLVKPKAHLFGFWPDTRYFLESLKTYVSYRNI
jgi:hypothetical protein